MSDSLVVAGIDVGGEKKGFHAVALRDGKYLGQKTSRVVAEIAGWCRDQGARFIGIDAPCGWREGDLRAAERGLKDCGISAFATPKIEDAGNPFYGWMTCGRKLYEALKAEGFTLFDGTWSQEGSICFETYPQAVACALKSEVVSAKGSQKRKIRRELLAERNLNLAELRNIDFIDAALCALTADYFARGEIVKIGEPKTGFIVVPWVPGSTLFPADLCAES